MIRDPIELLAQYRRSCPLPETVRQRTLAGLEARIAEGARPVPMDLPTPVQAAPWPWPWLGLAGTVGVAAIAVAVLAVAPANDQRTSAAQRGLVGMVIPDPPARAEVAPPDVPDVSLTAELMPEASRAPAPVGRRRRSPPPASVLGPDAAPAPAPSVHASTIDEEMRLLKSAQAALRAGRARAALAQLDDHERRFPRSKLSAARDVARMLALCSLGRRPQLEAARSQFLRTRKGSPFTSRVQGICRQSDAAPNGLPQRRQ